MAKLSPIYLFSSDVTLLLEEKRDQLLATAKKSGYVQRHFLPIEPGFDWSKFYGLTQNFSLFAEKQIIDLRNPHTKFDATGIKALLAYCEAPAEDTILIISMPKLTSAQQRARWHKKMSEVGQTEIIWPIGAGELPKWIQQRLKLVKLDVDITRCKLLAELTEGNLLATKQAIAKLALLYPQQRISAAEILAIINDNARYSVFDLVNHLLAGNAKKAIRVINRLRDVGTEPTLISWALSKQIRDLIQFRHQLDQSTPIAQVLRSQWQSQRGLLTQALQRLTQQQLLPLLQQSAATDRVIKGVEPGNLWDNLQMISLKLAQ